MYFGMLIAGTAYLAIRLWALGQLVHPLQRWAVLLGCARAGSLRDLCHLSADSRVAHGQLGPCPCEHYRFCVGYRAFTVYRCLALGVVTAGLYGLWRRHPLGGYVSCATVALIPVLHIVPVAFDPSLYHERYVMMSLAAMCVLMPFTFDKACYRYPGARASLKVLTALLMATWVGFAVANVRATLPLWSDDITLWRWALQGKSGLYCRKRSSSDRLHGAQRSTACARSGRVDCRRRCAVPQVPAQRGLSQPSLRKTSRARRSCYRQTENG